MAIALATTAKRQRLLDQLLASRLTPAALAWLRASCARVDVAGVGRDLFMAFGMAPRRVGKASGSLGDDERAAVARVGKELQLEDLRLDQLARVRLLLSLPADAAARLVAALDRLCADADLGELVVIYRALPLLPHPQALVPRAAEGLRSNMQEVFEAVALRVLARHGIPAADIERVCYANALAVYGRSGMMSEPDWLSPKAVHQRMLYQGNSVLRGQTPRVDVAEDGPAEDADLIV